jgi:hypothetical protein
MVKPVVSCCVAVAVVAAAAMKDSSQTYKARGLPHSDHEVTVWGLGADKVRVAMGHTNGTCTTAQVVVCTRLLEGGTMHVVACQRELK